MRIKYIIPFPLDEPGLAAREQQIPRRVLRTDTEIDLAPVRNSFDFTAPRTAESYLEWAILEMYVVEAGLKAEDEGYDAVVVDSTSDSGVQTLRSRLSIPVVGPGSVAFALATTLGKRFSILTYLPAHVFMYDDALRRYALERRCASVRAIGLPPNLSGEDDGGAEVAALVEAAKAAVEHDRADVLLLGSTTMHNAHAAIVRATSAQVIDPAPLALAAAEVLVNLGLSHSEVAYPSPGLVQDEPFESLVSLTRS